MAGAGDDFVGRDGMEQEEHLYVREGLDSVQRGLVHRGRQRNCRTHAAPVIVFAYPSLGSDEANCLNYRLHVCPVVPNGGDNRRAALPALIEATLSRSSTLSYPQGCYRPPWRFIVS
jgi:hypothetical protein